MKKYVDYYCKDNHKELIRITNGIILKNFGWLSQMHYDDFYSIAGEVLWNCVENFDESKGAQFETYLINCLIRKFKTRITYMNRKRRSNGIQNASLEALIEENSPTIMNLIASQYGNNNEEYSEKMLRYLNRLSSLQKKVLFLIAEGYTIDEIKINLNITSSEIANICSAIHSYRNVSLLY